MNGNRWNVPDLGLGIGLRARHYAHVLERRPSLGFFEVLSENYMNRAGRPAEMLDAIAEHYPIVMHGVSLSIGSTDPLDRDYLRRLAALADRVDARWVSDHVCWTGVAGINTHDLLPVPYTEEALAHMVRRVRDVSNFLDRPLVLENPSSYVAFAASSMTEEEFLVRLCDQADCGLLLDVNNVYVNAFNHGFDPYAYIDAIPADRVVEVHVAGHTHEGTHIIDTHAGRVSSEVWRLYERLCRRIGPVSTLLEWDSAIPAFDTVLQEVRKAEALGARGGRHAIAV